MTPTSKFPGLSTKERLTSSSTLGERKTPFPIASVSKSFCGAVCALMAVDGKFGDSGIDATLQEVLQNSKEKYPDRAENINKYLEMLENRGFLDVKISELLNHRSGCKDNDEIAPSACLGTSPLDFFSDHLGRGNCQRGEYRYSNNGYTLLEEVINLVSEKGSYQQELKERIIDRLELKSTGILEDSSDPNASIAKEHLSRPVFIPGAPMNPHSEEVVEEKKSFPANHTTPLGPVHSSCGGLYSSIDDLEKFSQELGKLIMGHDNSLTNKPKEASELYRQNLSNGIHYSLGLEFKDTGDGCEVGHTGLFPGNFANMKFLLPCNLSQLQSENPINTNDTIKTDIVLTKTDYMVASLFTEQAEAIPEKMIKKFVNSQLTEDERSAFADKASDIIENYLIEKNRLPENFSKIREEIFNNFKPAGDKVKDFLKENYLDKDGVIDSEKIQANFDKIEKVKVIIDPIFQEPREKAQKILSESTKNLSQHPRPTLSSPRGRAVEAGSQVGLAGDGSSKSSGGR